MKRLVATAAAIGLSALVLAQQPVPVEVVPVKPLERGSTLSTCSYEPSPGEKPFFKRLDHAETVTGDPFGEPYTIHGKKGRFVSWYGIVRGIRAAAGASGTYDLLVEQKYFDGLTDCHIMLVSAGGGGDFVARVAAAGQPFPALALVRVYGKVTDEAGGVPRVEAEFVRVWPWLTFTLTDLGQADASNPRWKEARTAGGGRVYKPFPTEVYYRALLGDPAQFGVALPADAWPR